MLDDRLFSPLAMKNLQNVQATPSFVPAKGISLHRQLFLALRDQILRGAFESGMLPTEEALCEQFGVSRITVRRALTDLAAANLVERRHGLGTFVRGGLSLSRAVPNLTLIESLKKSAAETQVKVLGVSQAVPPREVVSLLQLRQDEEAVHAIRLRSMNGVPVMLTDAWVPSRFRKHVTAAHLRKSALYEILLAEGIKFGRVIQEITVPIADPGRAELMKVEVGAPLLKLVRLMHDVDSCPVLHLSAYLSPERSRILMDIPGEAVNTLSAGQFVHDVR